MSSPLQTRNATNHDPTAEMVSPAPGRAREASLHEGTRQATAWVARTPKQPLIREALDLGPLVQRCVSGSPTGSPAAIATMLDFAARHRIALQTEHFPMSRINEAFVRLESGKARYRIVMDADP